MTKWSWEIFWTTLEDWRKAGSHVSQASAFVEWLGLAANVSFDSHSLRAGFFGDPDRPTFRFWRTLHLLSRDLIDPLLPVASTREFYCHEKLASAPAWNFSRTP